MGKGTRRAAIHESTVWVTEIWLGDGERWRKTREMGR